MNQRGDTKMKSKFVVDCPPLSTVGQVNVHADLGKAPQVKRCYTTPLHLHDGQITKTRDGTWAMGGNHASRYDADSGSPLSTPPTGKRETPPRIKPGMVSQQSGHLTEDQHFQLGAALLAASEVTDPQNPPRYGVGNLPPTVEEN
jgi:hypothetical protein